MAKSVNDVVLDGALNIIKNNSIRQVVCSADPVNFAGVAAVTLASMVMASGDYTIADDTSGRKITMAAKSGTVIAVSGTATHVVLTDNSAIMHEATTCTSQALTANGSNTVNVPAWKINIADPT